MKKLVSITLIAVMVLSLTGCGVEGQKEVEQSKKGQETGSTVEETIDLEFMAWYPVQQNANDAIVDYVNEKFNVNVEFTLADWEPNIENIAMRVASGDYPDVMLVPYYWVASLGEQYTAMIEDELLVNVSKEAEAGGYGNIVTELGRADQYNMRKVYGDESGDYYCIPRDDGFANPGIFVRQDWMEQLNLEQPQNFDDLKIVLKKLVEADLDGAGNVEGLTFDGVGWLDHFIVGFTGINTNGWYQNQAGEWSYKIFHPGFQEGLKYLNGLYKDKLIDPEFLNMKISNCRDKFLSGRAAMIMQNANSVDYIDFLEKPIKEYKEDAYVECLVPWPKGPSEKRNGSNPYGSMAVVFKSEDAKAQEKALEILDYILSDEGTDILLNGISGIHYEVGDKTAVIAEQRDNDFHGIEHHLFRHFAYPGVFKENLMPMLKENYEDIKATGQTPEIVGMNTERTAVLEPNLQSIYEKWLVAFVTGEADIELDYQKFIDEYNEAGYPEMLEEVNVFAAK